MAEVMMRNRLGQRWELRHQASDQRVKMRSMAITAGGTEPVDAANRSRVKFLWSAVGRG
jgi:hypothetical protein